MKVLFLTNIPSPYRVDFFNKLGSHCDLTVLYERHNASDRDKNWKANDIRNFKEVFLEGYKFRSDVALCFSVIKYLKSTYDIIVVGGYSTPTGMLAIQYLKFKKIPFIINCDGGFIKKDYTLLFYLKKYLISGAYAWLTSGKITSTYVKHYGANEENIFEYNFTSLNEDDLEKALVNYKTREQLKIQLGIKEEKVILAVGQFIPRKGFDTLLKAIPQLKAKNIGVYIVGGNPTSEYLSLVKELNLTNIHFYPFMVKSELEKYYKCSDIFVLPTREDIWGLVINEAMGYGLPIITTNRCIAGLELVKEGRNGYLIEVDDYCNLANKIDRVLLNNDTQFKYSTASFEIIQNYTIEKMALQHLKYFTQIVKQINLESLNN